MAYEIKTFVKRMSDKQALEAMKLVANIVGSSQRAAKVHVEISGVSTTCERVAASWDGTTPFDDMIGSTSEIITLIRVDGETSENQQYYLRWSRGKDNPYYDVVESGTSGGSSHVSLEHAKPFFLAMDQAFRAVSTKAVEVAALGPDVDRHFRLRELRIQQQERQLDDFFNRMREFTEIQTVEFNRRVADLTQDFERRRGELDRSHQTRVDELVSREADLAKRMQEFDVKESRGHRRAIQKSLNDRMAKTLEGFQLSGKVRWLRWPVGTGLGVATLLSGGLSVWLFSMPIVDATGKYDWVLVARQVVATALTVSFVSFFIGWCNRWASRNAEEEMKYKRLAIDLERASWLVETVLDWREQNPDGTPFPPELLKELSRKLFTDGATDAEEGDPSAMLARALFGTATRLRVGQAGAEWEYERNDLRKVSKEKDEK